ncbi:MAG TPA: SDR family oxidoreductase [Paenirhodobacter sp.]
MPKALITGAGRRLGREMALYLAGRGHDVAIHCHGSQDEAHETAALARARGVAAQVVVADLLDEDQTQGLVAQAAQALGGPLDVLVNSASIFEYDNIATATRTTWDRHLGSNLRAPFMLTQAFARQAPRADRSGPEPRARSLIINMVDQRVLKPTPEFITYSLAKAALWSLTKTSAQALAPEIRVNAIGPGPTMQGTRQSDSHFARQRAATILERGADAGDICAALGYFLDAVAVTGQLICVDGGQHLGWKTPDVLGPE